MVPPYAAAEEKVAWKAWWGGNAIVREAIEATRLGGVPTYIRELVEKKDEQVTPEVVFQAAEAGGMLWRLTFYKR